jgi:hypothetical protein
MAGTFYDFRWSSFAIAEFRDHFFRNLSYSPPTSLWIALGTNTGTALTGEPVGNGYARIEINGATGRSFTVPTVDKFGSIENNETWFFPRASGGNWGSMASVNVMDASSGGNLIMSARFTIPVAINDGEQYQINAGNLEFRNQVDPTPSTNFGYTGYAHGLFCNLMLRGDGSAAADTNNWFGLLTDDVSDASRNNIAANVYNEVSGNGYARQEVGDATPASGVNWQLGGLSQLETNADLDFPTITPASYPSNVYWVGVWDVSTNGNLLIAGRIRENGNAGSLTTNGLAGGKNSFFRVDATWGISLN